MDAVNLTIKEEERRTALIHTSDIHKKISGQYHESKTSVQR